MESWPFKVIDEGGNPKVEVQYLGETKQFSPQEISAMVLIKVGNATTDPRCHGSHKERPLIVLANR